jgi:hypothetical protein
MRCCAHSTEALGENPSVTRITILHDCLYATKHLRRRPRLRYRTAADFNINAKVAFYPSNWVYYYSSHISYSPNFFKKLVEDRRLYPRVGKA